MFQTGELGIQVGEDDPVGEALVELQGKVQRELDKSVREVDRAHTERDNVSGVFLMSRVSALGSVMGTQSEFSL